MSYEKKVKVVLHGYLKKLLPDEIYLTGYSAAEIINGMCKMTKAFNPTPGQPRHSMTAIGFTTKESLYEPLPVDCEELHLVPSMAGGKAGGFIQIVIGVVLIAAAFFTAGGSLAALAAEGSFSAVGIAFSMGISLVLGGLLSLLSPTPKADSFGNSSDPEASRYLGSSQNTVKIGTRIPIGYGMTKGGGQYLSFDVDAKDVDLSAA